MKQALGGWHGQKRAHLEAAAGFAEDYDVARIATESCDIGLHPAQARHDIEHTLITGSGPFRPAQLTEIEIPQKAQPVIGSHHHYVVGRRQPRAVLRRRSGRTAGKTAAMAIEHDRTLLAVIHRRRPDIEHQAILGIGRFLLTIGRFHLLQGGRTQMRGVADACPRHNRRRFAETRRARHRTGIGNALEGQGTTIVTAF